MDIMLNIDVHMICFLIKHSTFFGCVIEHNPIFSPVHVYLYLQLKPPLVNFETSDSKRGLKSR